MDRLAALQNRSKGLKFIVLTKTAPVAEPDETEAERRSRLAWEAAGIAKARASVVAARVVDSAKVKALIDSIGTSHELPVPYSGR
jgi:hypothetical protein